jgi:hypothetical protein
MNRFIRLTLTVSLLTLLLQACASGGVKSTSNKKPTDQAVTGSGIELVEGFFIAPGVDFSDYKKLMISSLVMENIAVARQPSKQQSTLVLTDNDKRFYRDLYTAAVVEHLIADGTYTTAVDAGQDVLTLAAAIVQVAPPVMAETGANKSAAMQAYTQSTSAITITLEIYDSQSRTLLATLTDAQDLGRSWDDTNRMAQATQVRLAFDYWLAYLRRELDILSGRALDTRN